MGARASASESALKPRVGRWGQRGGLPGPHCPPQSLSHVSFGQCHLFKCRVRQKVYFGLSVTSYCFFHQHIFWAEDGPARFPASVWLP